MGSRILHKIMAVNNGEIRLAGSFAPDTANNPAKATIKGKGFTVAHTATGVFTITFSDVFLDLLSAQATLQLATGDDKFAEVGTFTKASKTLVINIWDKGDGVLADVAIDNNNRVNFKCVFSNTSFN
jgi:hypothetical protein